MHTNDEKTLEIEIWSDVICPWCWIGKRRLERALSAFDQRDRVRTIFRSFRLMPGLAPTPIEAVLTPRLGSADKVREMLAHVEHTAKDEDLHYRLTGNLVGDTLDAHRLLQAAKRQGLQEVLIERLHRACLSERTSVFDHQSLLRLGLEAGLGRAEVIEVLEDSTRHMQDVDADQSAARAIHAGGVPLFRFGGHQVVSGAQTPSDFAAALSAAWASAASSESMPAGAACSTDGCA